MKINLVKSKLPIRKLILSLLRSITDIQKIGLYVNARIE